MNHTDNEQLASCITICFNQAMNPELSDAERTDMYVVGRRLRGALVNLLSMTFTDDLPELQEANRDIAAANALIKDSINDLNRVAAAIAQATGLASKLDSLLKFAVGILK